MSNMKCPFCGEKLEPYYGYGIELYSCSNLTCKGTYMQAENSVWQELIRTRKALDLALAELHEIDGVCDDNKYTDNLYVGLDGHDTRNIALDVKKTIIQITALTKGGSNE